mgnify:CR=1 FL=1
MATPPSGRRSIRFRRLARPLGVWAVMAVVAVLNGALRETVLVPRVGEYPGHVLSTALLVAAILALARLFFATGVAYSRAELVAVGALWTVLTVGFEFLVGHVEGTPVAVTLGQYDVFAGQVWLAVPVALFLAPLAFGSRG